MANSAGIGWDATRNVFLSLITLWVEVILCVWAVCKYVHRFIYIYISPIFIYLVPLKDTL